MNSNEQMNDLEDMKKDIWAIVGGHFSPDSLGPEKYEAMVARVRSRAEDYLTLLESLFLGPNFDAAMQSRLYLSSFLQLVADIEPERVHTIVAQLLKQINAVLVVYDDVTDKEALFKLLPEETVNLSQRLNQRRIILQELLK